MIDFEDYNIESSKLLIKVILYGDRTRLKENVKVKATNKKSEFKDILKKEIKSEKALKERSSCPQVR